NEKNYLAGSLHWRTGSLLAPVTGPRRDGKLAAKHLDELARRVRHYRKVHVLLDNAKTHRYKEPPLREVAQRPDATSGPGSRQRALSPQRLTCLPLAYPCTGASAVPLPADGFSINSSPN